MTNEELKFMELEKIRKRHRGVLKSEHIVAFAANEDTALHGEFEWDDQKAGHAHRIWQARRLIARVTIKDGKGNPIRLYASLVEDRKAAGGGYRTVSDVMNDADLRSQLLEQAFRDYELFKAKYDQLTELKPVTKAMARVEKKHAARTAATT